MATISINLLPEEILIQRKQSSKISLLNKLSAMVIVVLIFAASATLSLRIIQQSKLGVVNKSLAYARTQVTDMQQKEVRVALLKKRLDSIRTLSASGSKETAMYNLLLLNAPADISIDSLSIDQNGNSSLDINSTSLDSINTFLSTLSDPGKNAGLISQISMDGFSLSRDGIYRFNLKIFSK